MNYATVFAPVLKALREERGWSQYRLAEKADLDHSYVSRLETGVRAPGRSVVESLVVGLDLGGPAANELRLAAGYAPR